MFNLPRYVSSRNTNIHSRNATLTLDQSFESIYMQLRSSDSAHQILLSLALYFQPLTSHTSNWAKQATAHSTAADT